MTAMRPRSWPACVAAAAWLCLPLVASGAERDGSRPFSEQMSLESARYLFEVEGNAVAAHALLQDLQGSAHEEIRTQAYFLQGRFLERERKREGAVQAYVRALGGEGLSAPEKRSLISRLLELNPGALQPMRFAGKAGGLPSRVFPSTDGAATRYVLVEEAENAELHPPRLSWQDAEGMLHPFPAALTAAEEVLDATPEAVLTLSRTRQQVLLRRAPAFAAAAMAEKFAADEGLLFSGGGEEFLLIGTQGLRVARRGQTVFAHPLPGPGCSYHPASPRSRQGILFCPSQGVFRADFSRRSVGALALGGEAPSEVALSGDYLALRYVDHIEIRRGPAFDAFLWGFPSGTQDQLVLGREHAFLIGGEGRLRAFDLRTGQMDWQRDEDIAEALAQGNEVFALTHDPVCMALNDQGRILFTYEAGWGADPLLLPTRDWLVLHQSDGRRVRLNLDLLRLTGNERGYLFRGADERLRRHDLPGALGALNAILALEPGNGTAWRQKAEILRSLGAAKSEQTRAWLQAARSQATAAWSEDPALRNLGQALGASWIWKRHPGPRFFPTLTAGRRLSFYVENDNQTMAWLDNETGALQSSFHFPEVLDLKATFWIGDTVVVSSANRLYLLSASRTPGILAQIPLAGPICQALPAPGGLVYSDWNGSLRFIELPSRRTRWELRLGRGGLLLARGRNPDQLDVFEIEGGYHGVQLGAGREWAQAALPPGTITECHAGRDFAYAGYNEGLVVAVDRGRGTLAWKKDLDEQIFNMAGKGDVLLIGTASKKLLSIQGGDGAVAAQARLPTYLFNRPLMAEDAYWVGTTEPALEKRSLSHALLEKLPLTDMPGTPALVGNGIAISTLDHFIIRFPNR